MLAKLRSLWWVHFVLTMLFVLTLAPDMTVLYGNYVFFWERFSFFRKSVSKLKYWNLSKFPLIVTWHHANLSKGGLFWKSLVPFFRRIYAPSDGFKMKRLRKAFSSINTKIGVKTKNQPKFCCQTCWKEKPFIFTVYLMNDIFQTSILFNK